jgi:leucine-zipper of insertion element IS481
MTRQRYRAVLEGQAECGVTEVAERFRVSRQVVHRWIGGYPGQGLGPAGGSQHRPRSYPTQTSPQEETAIWELRRAHPRPGCSHGSRSNRRHHGCPGPIQSLSAVHQMLARHGLLDGAPGRRGAAGRCGTENRHEPLDRAGVR